MEDTATAEPFGERLITAYKRRRGELGMIPFQEVRNLRASSREEFIERLLTSGIAELRSEEVERLEVEEPEEIAQWLALDRYALSLGMEEVPLSPPKLPEGASFGARFRAAYRSDMAGALSPFDYKTNKALDLADREQTLAVLWDTSRIRWLAANVLRTPPSKPEDLARAIKRAMQKRFLLLFLGMWVVELATPLSLWAWLDVYELVRTWLTGAP